MILIGGSNNETDMVRNVIKSRWPYPITRDEELFLDEKNKAWLFKMKRQPWAVSYGNKSFDKAVEIAQTLLRKSLPPPKNTDADSGKSILVFLLKVSNNIRNSSSLGNFKVFHGVLFLIRLGMKNISCAFSSILHMSSY